MQTGGPSEEHAMDSGSGGRRLLESGCSGISGSDEESSSLGRSPVSSTPASNGHEVRVGGANQHAGSYGDAASQLALWGAATGDITPVAAGVGSPVGHTLRAGPAVAAAPAAALDAQSAQRAVPRPLPAFCLPQAASANCGPNQHVIPGFSCTQPVERPGPGAAAAHALTFQDVKRGPAAMLPCAARAATPAGGASVGQPAPSGLAQQLDRSAGLVESSPPLRILPCWLQNALLHTYMPNSAHHPPYPPPPRLDALLARSKRATAGLAVSAVRHQRATTELGGTICWLSGFGAGMPAHAVGRSLGGSSGGSSSARRSSSPAGGHY